MAAEHARNEDEMRLMIGQLETTVAKQKEELKQWKDIQGRVLIFEK